MGRGPDVEVDHAGIGDDPGPDQVGDGLVVVGGRLEARQGAGGRPPPPDQGAVAGYPVSVPSQNGELADNASSAGSQGAARRATAMARSRSSISTCTCVPQTSCSRTSIRYSPR